MNDRIKQLAKEYKEEIIKIRQHIHQHPELSFQEHKTMKYISSLLKEWGIEHKTKVAKTGIMGHIRGKNPDSKMIMLRADIDALPIKEQNTVSYCSTNEGVMHACGHDVHTASLLGTLKILNQLKDEFEGSVRFIFQPAEEKFPGGAKLMIEAGVLEKPKPDLVIGQHVYPDFEAGSVGFKEGIYMGSADEITITVKGKGGHAAMPEKTPDTILTAAQMLVNMQTVVSRSILPEIPSVLSFGHIQGGHVFNVIPSEVLVRGTFRTFSEEWRDKAHKRITQIAKHTAMMNNLEVDVNIDKGYPFLYNDVPATEQSITFASTYLGPEYVERLPIRMAAEDFAYFSHECPSVFYRLGVANKSKDITAGLHTPLFNIDEKALETGSGLMASLTISHLEKIKK
ncbi:MAG: M20 family metallopeptidase [Hyphomicrobiales bacterium]